MAPVRRSETKHQVPKIAGCPGLIALTYTRPARHSATSCARAPASAAGAVAPAWPAESNSTGMPPRTATSRHLHASVANFMGGTTKQFDWLTNGRSRHCCSPPAIRCSISSEASTCSGCTQLLPTCLVVDETAA